MLRKKSLRITLSSLLLLLAAWVATPKVYIHELLHHDHHALDISKETQLQSPASDDCDFHKYDKPVYFNIFKFIGNLVPSRQQNSLRNIEKAISLTRILFNAVSLRGPPVTE